MWGKTPAAIGPLSPSNARASNARAFVAPSPLLQHCASARVEGQLPFSLALYVCTHAHLKTLYLYYSTHYLKVRFALIWRPLLPFPIFATRMR